MPLLHISFRDNLEKIWYPRDPTEYDPTPTSNEPDIPRISVSPTVIQCFWEIYPNVSKYFEKENYPYMEFYVYEPNLIGEEEIITPDILTYNKWVADAHITQEHWIMEPVDMQKKQKIKILNTNSSPGKYFYPFNNPKKKVTYLAPEKVLFQIVEQY